MIRHAELVNEQEAIREPDLSNIGGIELATAGWDSDSGENDHVELGTDNNGGVTFIRVQLFRGRDISEPLKDGVAQGHKIRVRPLGPFWMAPPRGTQCLVALPGGFVETPGAGVLLGWLGASPFIQFSATRAVLAFPGMDLVIRARRISIQNEQGDFVAMTPDAGVQIVNKDGSGITLEADKVQAFSASSGDAKSVLMLTASEASLMQKDGSFVTLQGGDATIQGSKVSVAGGSVALGAHASPATPVVVGPTGTSGVGSTSVYGQP